MMCSGVVHDYSKCQSHSRLVNQRTKILHHFDCVYTPIFRIKSIFLSRIMIVLAFTGIILVARSNKAKHVFSPVTLRLKQAEPTTKSHKSLMVTKVSENVSSFRI